MLLLTFQIGNERYAVRAIEVIEILPLASLRKIPQAPNYIAGMLDYRHQILPVIDLVQLTEDRPHNKVLSSRIIIMKYPLGVENTSIGLIAEKVTDTIDVAANTLSDTKIKLPNADYLGEIHNESGEFIQLIEIKSILTQDVQDMLFQDENMQRQNNKENQG